MDQSAINKIIMDASEEDPSKKVEKLEKEVMIIKGSIKKLIVDIREQMNNAENPFLNIQQLQMPPQAPISSEDLDKLEEAEKAGQDEEEQEAKKPSPKDKKRKKPSAKDPEEEELGDDCEDHSHPDEETADLQVPRQQGLSRRDLEMISEFEEQKKMLEAMKSKTSAGGPASLTGTRRIDPFTMNQIMDWTRMMLRKNGSERMKDLLEMYVSTGYISEETRAIIQRMSKLMESEPTRPPKRLDIKECVSDLYTLYVILNPGDKDLDSKMLTVLLNPEDKH
ncbi:MAG: FlaD/FlaE family flagellar protein [Methanocella sp.]